LIYICIPTHNEQQTVGVVLWKLRQVLTDFPREYQLLVVDDASTDRTPEVLEPYTRVLPLTVVRSERRLGHGASLELLLREAVRRSEYPKRDVVVTLQADFSDEPDDLVPLIKRLEAGADVAVGNKVAKSKASRVRRFSLALAGFFTRREQWPEGVETPFDGYRAYRVHAVKRAIESREGRLIRHDGWAAHADLLRQVLPHARRVDALAVVDRTDRLQRARRERPFAAALAVRSMSRGAAPAGLVPVAELDSIVATASRSRDRGRMTQQSARNGRSEGSQANGARPRDRDGAGGARTRGPAGERTRTGRGGRAQDATSDAPKERQRKQRPKPAPRRKQDDTARAATEPAPDAVAPIAGASTDVPGTTPPVADVAVPPKKKRRRRRRRASAATAAAATGETSETPTADVTTELPTGNAPGATGNAPGATGNAPGETSGDAPGETSSDALGETSGDALGETSGDAPGEQKRRRRGGRRGGRGRRRTARPDGDAESAAPADSAHAPADSVHAPADSVHAPAERHDTAD
jgi:hypothetical protein